MAPNEYMASNEVASNNRQALIIQRALNPRLLSYMAPDDVASNIRQSLIIQRTLNPRLLI